MATSSAQRIAQSLASARSAWGLSREQLARRAGIPESEVQTAERSGRVDVSSLAALAGALGGTLDDVLTGQPFWTAPALAMKSAGGEADPAEVRYGLIHASAAARDYQALASHLGLPDLWAERGAKLGPVGVSGRVVEQAEALALRVREELQNPLEPLASVRAAMMRLGVASFFTEFASDEVDGAMWRAAGAAPCVAVNALARGGRVTAVRMTLAHELGHALFDRPKQAEAGLVEVRTPRSTALEQRANAFAAWLLAPREGVARFLRESGLGAGEQPTRQHLLSLSLQFGLGVEAMAWHLVNCGYWGEEAVQENRGVHSPHFASTDDRELHPSPAEAEVPLERRGVLLDLATQALAQKKLTVGRWRELLKLEAVGDWRLLLRERHIEPESEHYLGLA